MSRKSVAKPRPGECLTNPRDKGDWAEMMFMAKAASLGFTVSRPFGAVAFDFVIGLREGPLSRIQVKSAWSKRDGMYEFTTRGGGGRRYTPSEVDFIVGYVVPEDVWYVAPFSEIRRKAAHVAPHKRGSRARFEQFREAWHLLRAEQLFPPTTGDRRLATATEYAERAVVIDLPSMDAARCGFYCPEQALAGASS